MPVTTPLQPADPLIELAYNGPLEETPWHGFLKALGQRIGCRSAGFTLRLSRAGRSPLVIWGDPPSIDDEEARRIRAAHAELGHLDPLRNALNKPGDIHTLDEVTTPEVLHASEFYRRVLKPYGIEHALGMYVSEPGGWEGNLGLINDGDADFTDADRELLLALKPHIERSLAVFAKLQRHESELHALTETLDRLTISTFILDDRGRVLRANGAGQALAKAGQVLRIAEEQLRLVNRGDDARMKVAIEAALAARAKSSDASFVDALRVRDAEEQNLGVLVRTVGRSIPFLGDAAPALIVYLSGASDARPVERLVMQLFDLTPSEAQLATLLAAGLTIAESAERLGLTENTARTYSKIIFSKTGVGRQAELIRLILRSVAVLG
ncbi:helix-turn-helix transcriptional regulator [Sphingoaurantiacus capsulatus]|uniref:Helix-turn-helix transcriptional regulator n=1 Tax=Sphingoaurantiacus capsulatus TaxID=1771310 RepID=A0ABV7X615_9SPHN